MAQILLLNKIYVLRVLQTSIRSFTKFVFLGSLYFTLCPKWDPYILETSEESFGRRHKHTKIVKYASRLNLPRKTRRSPLLSIGNWKERPCLLEKMPRLRKSIGKFLINKAVLGVPRWKKSKFFPIRPFVCLLQLKCFSKCPKKHLLSFRPARIFTLSIHSFNDSILSNLSILTLIFHSHAT